MPSESELLAHIARATADLAAAGGPVVVGPGDDCAVVRTGGGELLLTVDQLVEGRHFEAGAAVELIARKAVARSVSDIAAMGGRCVWGLATGLLPDGYAEGAALFDAMHGWARRWGCPLVGGDIAFGPGPLSLTVAVAGVMADGVPPVLRRGARPGDHVWLTGPIGNSLGSGWHLGFEPRIDAGRLAAAAGATAMIDLSDGLGRDAGRVGESSGAIVEINAAAVPLREGARELRRAIADGEDYELLIVAPAAVDLGDIAQRIGRVRSVASGEPPGAELVFEGGRAERIDRAGWDHG